MSNIHLDEELKLGKQGYRSDPKTIVLGADLVDTSIQVPKSWDFDKRRAKFPVRMWGNDQWGDCVLAAHANQEFRLERVEARRTPKIEDQDVIDRYKAMTGSVSPGDDRDNGLVMLDALRNWRAGWAVKTKTYNISAFGRIPVVDQHLMRLACYLFNGLQLGFDLPISARSQTSQGYWDVTPGSGDIPGSWGGHAVMSKRFDADNLYVLTWGREVRVTNAFVERYCDEAWAIIDSFDPWRKTHGILDVDKLVQTMRDNGISVQT